MIKQSNYHFPSVYKYTVKGYPDTMHSAEWQNEHEAVFCSVKQT